MPDRHQSVQEKRPDASGAVAQIPPVSTPDPAARLLQHASSVRFVGRGLLVDAAIAEALDQNLTLIATRAGVTRADANLITAGLRPNPVLSVGSDHLRLHNRYSRSKKEEKQSLSTPNAPNIQAQRTRRFGSWSLSVDVSATC